MEFIEEIEDLRCRCCLNEAAYNIFDVTYNEIKLNEILSVVAPIAIAQDDGLPQFICDDCKTSAIEAFLFRETCVATDESLNSTTSHHELVEEVIDMSTEAWDKPQDDDEDLAVEREEEVASVNCAFCGENFGSMSELTDHIETIHQQYENHEVAEQDESNTEQASNHKLYQQSNDIQKPQIASNSSRKYECFVCSKRMETPSKLRRHLYVHRNVLDPELIPEKPNSTAKDNKYECEFCSKRVATPSKLQRHLRVHDRKAHAGINSHRPVECQDCDLRFWQTDKLERHRVIHSEDFKRSKIVHPDGFMFTCVLCLHKLPSFEDCIAHMKGHREDAGEKSERMCQLCSKTYPTLANLIRHSKSHEENATHACVYCGKRLGMGDDLLDHLLRHQDFKPFACDFPSCGKKFLKHYKLKQHMTSHEENPSKHFTCGHCDRKFTELDYLKRHLIRHSGRKDHKCTICQAEFTFKSGLTSHMTTHSSEKLFPCASCASKFSNKQALKAHLKVHTGEKKFACDQCSLRFTTSGHLSRHKLTHSGLKPFQCNYCGKSYSQSNDLMKHLRTHLGPNVYKCDVPDCQEAFAKFGELKVHKTTHSSAAELMTEESYDISSIGSIKLLYSNKAT